MEPIPSKVPNAKNAVTAKSLKFSRLPIPKKSDGQGIVEANAGGKKAHNSDTLSLETKHLRPSNIPAPSKDSHKRQTRNVVYRNFEFDVTYSKCGDQVFKLWAENLVHPYLQELLNLIWRGKSVKACIFQRNFDDTITNFLVQVRKEYFGQSTSNDFPEYLIDASLNKKLPDAIGSTLTAIHVPREESNFYHAFSTAYLGNGEGAEAFRSSIIHRALTIPNGFSNLCAILGENEYHALNNLRKDVAPTAAGIATLSQVLEREIILLEMDRNGNITADISFKFGEEVHCRPPVYIGKIPIQGKVHYFPFVKIGKTSVPPLAKTSAVAYYSDQRLKPGTVIIEEIAQDIHSDKKSDEKEPHPTNNAGTLISDARMSDIRIETTLVKDTNQKAPDKRDGDITSLRIRGQHSSSTVNDSFRIKNKIHTEEAATLQKSLHPTRQAAEPLYTPSPIPEWILPKETEVFYQVHFRKEFSTFLPTIQQMFRKCEKCHQIGFQVCQHAIKSSYMYSTDVQHIFMQPMYGNFTEADVPISTPLVRRRLPVRLSDAFVAFDVPEDGNCGFNALSFCLTLDVGFGKMLRRAAYMETICNQKIALMVKRLPLSRRRELSRRLLNDGKWMTSFILIILSEYLQRPIVVYERDIFKEIKKGQPLPIAGTVFNAGSSSNLNLQPLYIFGVESVHFYALIKKNVDSVVPPAEIVPGELKASRIGTQVRVPVRRQAINIEQECATGETAGGTQDEDNIQESKEPNFFEKILKLHGHDYCGAVTIPSNDDAYKWLAAQIERNQEGCQNNERPNNAQVDVEMNSGGSENKYEEPHAYDDERVTSSAINRPLCTDIVPYKQTYIERLVIPRPFIDDFRRNSSVPLSTGTNGRNFNNPSMQQQTQPAFPVRSPNAGQCIRDNFELYNDVLESIKENLILDDSQANPTESVLQFLNQTNWRPYTGPRLSQRRYSNTAFSKMNKTIFMKQKTLRGRRSFVSMLYAAKLDEDIVTVYIQALDKKFGYAGPMLFITNDDEENDSDASAMKITDGTNNTINGIVIEPQLYPPAVSTFQSFEIAPPNLHQDGSKSVANEIDTIYETNDDLHPESGGCGLEVTEELPDYPDHCKENNKVLVEDCRSGNEGWDDDEGLAGNDRHTSSPDAHTSQRLNPETDIEEEENMSPDTGEVCGGGISNVIPEDMDIDVDEMCKILEISKNELLYQPPLKFVIEIDPDWLNANIYNFQKNMFVPHGGWPTIINRAMSTVQKSCSFNATKAPRYLTKQAFCRMYGKCAGDCDMTFEVTIHNVPTKGSPVTASVTSAGAFRLFQKRSTGRQIRNVDRDAIKKYLENQKAKAVFLKNFDHLSALQAVHRNHVQRSEQSVRKMKSEINTSKRLDADPAEEIKLLYEKYINAHPSNKIVPGFLQHINIFPGFFKLFLYEERALRLHLDQRNRGITICYGDASGGFIRKLTPKQPLLYVLMAKNFFGVSYQIALMISERGRNTDISNFFSEVKGSLKLIRHQPDKSFASIFVVDFSFAMLAGVSKGINDLDLDDYLEHCWDVLNLNQPWKSKRTCIFICTNHLLKAAERLFSKKLQGPRSQQKRILNAALNGMGRLQEAFDMKEFGHICRVVINVFGRSHIAQEKLDDCIAVLNSRKTEEYLEGTRPDEDEHDSETEDIDEDNTSTTLRGRSKFYQRFKSIEEDELETGVISTNVNPYYSPAILKAIGDHKIPMWPFWAAAIPRLTKDPLFMRESNAAVESNFNLRKNIYRQGKHQLYTDFVQEAYDLHGRSLKESVDKILMGRVSTKEKAKPSEVPPEEADESWQKRTPSKRKSRHLSNLLSPALSSQEKGDSTSDEVAAAETAETNDAAAKSSTDPENTKDTTVNLELNIRNTGRGIPNFGNTCYMNACIQCILHLPFITRDDLSLPLRQFYDVIFRRSLREYGDLSERANDARINMTVTLGKFTDQNVQHDVHEFFLALLNDTECGLLRASFEMMHQTDLKCCNTGCEGSKQRYTQVCELDIMVNEEVGVAVDKSSAEVTNVECKCDICASEEMIKTTSIMDGPECLLVRSGVFDPNSFTGKVRYSRTYVPYVEQLDLPTVNGTNIYRIHSLITHIGATANSGHYIAYHYVDGTWYQYNDSVVRTVGEKLILNDEYVYLSFYLKGEVAPIKEPPIL